MQVHKFVGDCYDNVEFAYIFTDSTTGKRAMYFHVVFEPDKQLILQRTSYARASCQRLIELSTSYTWEEIRLELLIKYNLTYQQVLEDMHESS